MINKLSYTAINRYLNCPAAYKRYYLDNMREKVVGSALLFGSAIDNALNTLLLNKQNNVKSDISKAKKEFLKLIHKQSINNVETELSKTNLIKYSNTDFDPDVLTNTENKLLQDVVSQSDLSNYHEDLIQLKREKRLTGEALEHFNYMSWVSLKQKGLLFIDAYEEQVIPTIDEVIEIQKFISIKNDEGDEFLGFVDYIARLKDENGIFIMDNKTSSSAYKPTEAKTSKQLASYVGVLNELGYTKETLKVGFNVLNKKIRKKKEPKVYIQIIKDTVDNNLIDRVFNDYDLVNSAIHEGHFESNSPECSKNNYGSPCLCELPLDQLVYVPKKERK